MGGAAGGDPGHRPDPRPGRAVLHAESRRSRRRGVEDRAAGARGRDAAFPALCRGREPLFPRHQSQQKEPRHRPAAASGRRHPARSRRRRGHPRRELPPGVMDRLGLGYDALAAINPGLIYCAISGFGMTGPLSTKPSFDIVTQALTGALSINGERGNMPVKLGIPLGDMVGGVFGPMAILAALHERSQTGRGRLIDISLHDGLIGMLGYFAQLAFITGEDPKPMGSSHPNIVPYGSFPASDGSIIIAVLSERFWGKLCEALERPEFANDPRFLTPTLRRDNRDDLDRLIADVTGTRTVAEWEARLAAADVPHAPVLGVTAAF